MKRHLSLTLVRTLVRMRRVMPAWFDRFVRRALASRRGPIVWVKAALAAGSQVPEPPHPDLEAPIRLLVAPFNYAGQGAQWARAVNGPGVSARSLSMDAGGFHRDADVIVPTAVFLGSKQWRQSLDAALGEYTHVIIESFGSLEGRGTGQVVLKEIERLRGRGIRVALLCHGSDIRSPRAFIQRHPDTPTRLWGEAESQLQRTADEGAEVLARFDGPVFVSTLDLLADAPGATWLPVVVDAERWRRAGVQHDPHEGIPRVMHAPSHSGIKGSSYVEQACEALASRGVISFARFENVPAEEMPTRLAEADIVVDQLLLGSYGVAACEAMAAGRVVVGNVSPEVREQVRVLTGLELPIVQADAGSLEQVLASLAVDRIRAEEIAMRGPEFVRAVHSGSRTASAMSDFLGGYASSGYTA